MTPRRIAIDGPAGAGKSTIGALVAERLGHLFLDTGAMYRAVALQALREKIHPEDGAALAALARDCRIALGPPTKRDGRAYHGLLHEILRRDQLDRERVVAPLKAAPDAIVVETDGHTVGEALERVLQAVAERSR